MTPEAGVQCLRQTNHVPMQGHDGDQENGYDLRTSPPPSYEAARALGYLTNDSWESQRRAGQVR